MKWRDGEGSVRLCDNVAQNGIPKCAKADYENELQETNCIKICEPACGDWTVYGDEGKVWVDASSLAIGALIQIGQTTMEDAIWLRKERSDVHINMAE